MVTERSLAYAVCTADYGRGSESRNGQGSGSFVGPGYHFGKRSHPLRGHSRRGKNHPRPGLFPGFRAGVRTGPVYAGCVALRCHRLLHLQQRDRLHDLSARRRFVQSVPGRRAEPRHLPDPVGPSGSYGRRPGHRGRTNPPDPPALYRHRHAKPGGRRRNPAAPRQSNGPVHHPSFHGISRSER